MHIGKRQKMFQEHFLPFPVYSGYVGFQSCAGQSSSYFHRLDIVNVYGTAQHIEGVIVFNHSLEERIVSQVIQYDIVSAIRHVEYDFLIAASGFCIMGCSGSDTQGIYIDIALAEGFEGQAAAVRHYVASV